MYVRMYILYLYISYTRTYIELQAELQKQAQREKSRGDVDALQGTNTVKIEVYTCTYEYAYIPT